MNRNYYIALVVFTVSMVLGRSMLHAEGPSPDPEALFRTGLAKYEDGDFQEGVDLFTQALAHAGDPPPFDQAMTHYNLGIGYFRLSQPDKASAYFQDSLRTPDINLQGRSYYNLGNAQYQSAKKALEEGDLSNAFKLYQAASSNYIQCMRIQSSDMDAKINYELALAAQSRILQWVTQAIRHMKQGDELVGEFRFAEAAAWFQQNYEAIDKALSLEPEAKKQFEQLTQRTTAVAEIKNPGKPAVPAP